MYVESVPNRNSPPAVLPRESYRDGGKVKKRTLANLSHRPVAKVEALRQVPRGELLVAPEQAVTMLRSLPHGHVAAALDWLIEQQPRIEKALARHHLEDGTLVLYDVTSSYFADRTCALAGFGHSRDGRPDRLRIVFGLLCTGCPVAVEVFDGNVGDPTTLAARIDKLKRRFGLSRVVRVGDRGTIT